MFTGIIENLGEIKAINREGGNIHFTFTCPFVEELKIDQSIAHNGVCLTVVSLLEDTYTVTAIDETLNRTNLSEWKVGDHVNLERCMAVNSRFDGHIVQGHVDTVATCIQKTKKDGSWIFIFHYEYPQITVEKGAITINGTSLTVVQSKEEEFSVHIIPYTYQETTFHHIEEGNHVNIEFDIIGKYVSKLMQVHH